MRVARAPRAGRAARVPGSPPWPCGRPQTRSRRRRVLGLQLDDYSHQHLLLRAVVAAADVLEAAVPARVPDGRPAPTRGRGAPPLATQNTAVSRFTASISRCRGRRRAWSPWGPRPDPNRVGARWTPGGPPGPTCRSVRPHPGRRRWPRHARPSARTSQAAPAFWAGRGDPGILSPWMKASKVYLAAVWAAWGFSRAPRAPGALLWRVCGRRC